MTKFSRRQFLYGLGGGGAGLWLNLGAKNRKPLSSLSQGDRHVYVARNGSYAENVARVLHMAGGIQAFIDADDVVLLKPNGQWKNQGYTHTGCMKALIDLILQRPGGFSGEIVIIEHVQRNAADTLGPNYCWNMAPANRLNNWPDMNYLELVQDYHDHGRMNVSAIPLLDSFQGDFVRADGPDDLPPGKHGWVTTTYVTSANGRTAYLPYALLRSPYSGKIIDVKNGVWQNGGYSSQKVKLIFLPTLNNHGSYNVEDYAGPTSAVKCHLGVVAFNGTPGTSNLHNIGYSTTVSQNRPDAVGEAVGHLITSVIQPTFYMTCAEYTGHRGRTTSAAAHTKTVGLCADPVTLDYWMCKYVMLPAAPEQSFMNPDLDNNLRKTLQGCRSKGVGTIEENRIVVHFDDPDLIGTWDGQGVYYLNSNTDSWVKLATPAILVEACDLNGDGIDDLIGVWPGQGGVWTRYSSTGAWALLSTAARDIAAGDMNGNGRADLLGTWDGQGVFYRDSMTGAWVKLATPAEIIATGDLDGDGIDDLIGVWPGQGGVWVKYSSIGGWALLSTAARDIASGMIRGGAVGAGLTGIHPDLPGPFGGFAQGPFGLPGTEDRSADGPGGLRFLWHEEKNLVPQEPAFHTRIPGPGEPGFRFIEKPNLVPGKEARNRR